MSPPVRQDQNYGRIERVFGLPESGGQPAKPRTVRALLEDGIGELASVAEWHEQMVARHGELSSEMEELFDAYRRAVRDRSLSRFERELVEIMGMEVQR